MIIIILGNLPRVPASVLWPTRWAFPGLDNQLSGSNLTDLVRNYAFVSLNPIWVDLQTKSVCFLPYLGLILLSVIKTGPVSMVLQAAVLTGFSLRSHWYGPPQGVLCCSTYWGAEMCALVLRVPLGLRTFRENVTVRVGAYFTG